MYIVVMFVSEVLTPILNSYELEFYFKDDSWTSMLYVQSSRHVQKWKFFEDQRAFTVRA